MKNKNNNIRIKKIQRSLLFLLVIIGIINYMDRATLAIANTAISDEFSLSKIEMGYLLSAFSLTYAFLQLPVGAFLDRAGSRLLLGIGLIVWSAAQLAGGLTHNFKTLLLTRVILGAGEAPQFPAAAKCISEWFNMKERGRAVGIFTSSASMGTALAPPILTGLMLTFGWRWMFIIMGVSGILLGIIWLVAYKSRAQYNLSPEEVEHLDQGSLKSSNEKPTSKDWLNLFKNRSTWGVIFGFMGIIYVMWMYLSWLPAYLNSSFNISLTETAWFTTIPFLFAIAGSISSGFISERWIKRGAEIIQTRKSLVTIGLLLSAAFTIPAAYASTVVVATIYISLAQFFIQLACASSWALVTSIVPSNQTASLGGAQNFGGYLAGSAAPIVTGYLAQHSGNFKSALIVTGCVAVCAAVIHYALVRRPQNEICSNSRAEGHLGHREAS
ncbi:MFS transporter [Pseudomonas sp. DCB_AW]|uniref:MFS transporter n=1 Tax=Pseudomonas sp. DCB_AW TaxID=2993596 RepID=UPI0022489170|nr:MFS transporter [Pseudomonas sp. DCB_AW]MCX2684650.1 MFS transporter [Pseudomonas sp. DCB_AW]